MEKSTATERRGFLVRGRVQGVGFRWWTQRTGRRLGIGGHVRNLPDGSVEVHAAGPVEQLVAFERQLHRGPEGALVESVELVDADDRTPTEEFLMEQW